MGSVARRTIKRAHSVIRKVPVNELAFYGLRAPKSMNWPTCAHCKKFAPNGRLIRRDVDSVELVERTPTTVTILGKCHGKEDALKVDFGVEFEQDDLSFAWRNLTFFEGEIGR